MLILALDTTTAAGSVALARNGATVALRGGDPTVSHGCRLPGDVASLLQAQRLTVQDIDLFGVAAGPGSFTGLRVGIATIQGLALALSRRVVPVSTLEAIAYAACDHAPIEVGTRVVACMDGQRGDLFIAEFAAMASAPTCLLSAISEAASVAPDALIVDLLDSLKMRSVFLAGDGALLHGASIDAATGQAVPRLDPMPPLAPTIARLAFARHASAVVPHAIQPIYVRRSDAEIARQGGGR